LFPREQLVERIQLHELQAGLRKDFRARNFFERARQRAARPAIAVMVRQAKDFVLFIEQHKVHAPSVCTHGDDLFAVFLPGQHEAVLDFRPQPQHIPAERLAEIDAAVRKAVHFFELKFFAVPQAGHDAPAFRAEVHREINFFSHS
jgi:hypothetical protein